MNNDRKACMKTYNELCSFCAGKSYPEVLAAAGLKCAYTPGRVKSTAAFIRDYLVSH